MADFLLSVGVDVGLSYDQMQKDISDLVAQLNQNPQRIVIGLEIDHSAIERFRTEVANIHNTMGGLGRVTVDPVDTAGLNNAIDGVSRLAQSTQGAISTVQTMRAELASVNAEKIEQAIASINGISAEGAESLTRSLSEANVRATEVRASFLEAADAEQQLVALQVRGTNEAGHMVNYLMTYNTETGKISRRMVDITARLEDASSAESRRATTVREVTDLYRQMHALMRTNTNATNTASYAELAEQANLLRDALALASTESISIDDALAQLGTSGVVAITAARDAMAAFRLEMEQTGVHGVVSFTTLLNTAARMRTMLSSAGNLQDTEVYNTLRSQLEVFLGIINNVNSGTMSLEQALTAAGVNGATAIQEAVAAMATFRLEMSGAASQSTVLALGTQEYTSALSKVNTLLTQVRQNAEKWTKAKKGKSATSYTEYSSQIQELERLQQRLMSGSLTAEQFSEEFNKIKNTTSGAAASIRAAGEDTQSFGDRIKSLSEKFSTWFSITRVIMAAYRAIKQMVTNVKELDSALTQLKIVTGATDAEMTTFLTNATSLAKELGQSISDILSSIEVFSRLGYNLVDATQLAEYASILSNVAAVTTDEATTGLTSIIKGYNMDVSEAEHVADVLIEVGQKYAVSAGEMMEAYEKSGAALNATNTSFEKSAGLIAAANASVQNASTVGTALKTISARIRGATSDLEELGEDTEGLADGFSKYAEEIEALTGFDIMIDDSTYKDIYDIFEGLSQVWDKLTDTQQARVSEILGGTRQLQVISSIIGNWSDAANAYESAMTSAGVATEANATYMESIEGHIGTFKAIFQELSNNLVNSDLIKGIVDFGSTLLNLVNGIIKFADACGGLPTVLMAVASVLAITKAEWIAHLASVVANFVVTKFVSIVKGVISVFKSLPVILSSATTAWKQYAAGTASASAAMQASIPVIGLVLSALTLLVAGVSLYNNSVDDSREATHEAAKEAASLSDEIGGLAVTYAALSSSVNDNSTAKESLLDTQNELIKSLGLEQYQIDGLISKYGDLSTAILDASLHTLQTAEIDLSADINTSADELLDAAGTLSGVSTTLATGTANTDGNVSAYYKEIQDAAAAYEALLSNGYLAKGDFWGGETFAKYATYGDVTGVYNVGLRFDWDLKSIDGVFEAYTDLQEMLMLVNNTAGSNNYIYEALYAQYQKLDDVVSNYNDSVSAYNSNLVQQAVITALIGEEVPTTTDEFNNFKQGVVDAATASGKFVGSADEIEAAIDGVLRNDVSFAGFYENSIDGMSNVGDATDDTTKKLGDLADALSNLKKSYSLVETAQEEMADGGISVDTINTLKSLCDEEENYLDYLYEENGVIKLNVDLWKKRSEAILQGEIATLETTIANLEDENTRLKSRNEEINTRKQQIENERDSLEANAKSTEEQFVNGNISSEEATDAVYIYLQGIDALNNELGVLLDEERENSDVIEANTAAIDENQSKLSIYSAAYNTYISSVGNATAATNAFTEATSKIYSANDGLSQLAKIYEDVANGGDFDWGSILNNDTFAKTFGGLGDAYLSFIETIANSPNDLNACQDAFDALTAAYVAQSGVLDGVTEDTRAVSVAMLESMGIANAAEVVDAKLAYDKELLRLQTEGVTDKTYDEIIALYNECEAGSLTSQILAQLAAQKLLANENGIQTASDIEQLEGLANAANATIATLNNLAKAKAAMANYESYMDSYQNAIADESEGLGFVGPQISSYWKALADEAFAEAQSYLSQPLEFSPVDFSRYKVNYSGNSGSSSGGGSNSSSETWFERQYKDHQHWLAMDMESTEDYLDWLNEAYQQAYSEGIIDIDEYYKYQEEVYKGYQDLFKDYLGDIDHEVSLLEKGVGNSDEVIALVSKAMAEIEKELVKARAAGLDENGDYIQYLEQQWADYAEKVSDLRADAESEAQSSIDDLVDYRIKMLKQEIQDEKDALDEKLDNLQNFYDKQREMLQDQYDEEKYLEEQSEKRKSVADIQAELAMLANDNSAWAQKRRLELQEELAEAEKELNSFERDHALDVTLDALDEQQAAQEAQIQAEMDALDEKLNDPHALFNQALEDIKNNTEELYKEFIEYNRKYGTGNDQDIIDMWEGAYIADNEYQDTHDGEHLDDIAIGNYTGYVEPENPTPPQPEPEPDTPAETAPKTEPESTAPSLAKGSTVTVKSSATHFSAKSGNARMASFVPGGTYTVYQLDGEEVLIGLNGVYTGWINKSDIVGYASGTENATAGLHSLDELGSEYLFTSSDGNKYRVLNSGDKVLNAKATDFLYDFANSGGEILEKIIKSVFGTSLLGHIQPVVNHNEIRMGDIVVQGSATQQTVSEIRRAQRENLSEMLKSLNKLNK